MFQAMASGLEMVSALSTLTFSVSECPSKDYSSCDFTQRIGIAEGQLLFISIFPLPRAGQVQSSKHVHTVILTVSECNEKWRRLPVKGTMLRYLCGVVGSTGLVPEDGVQVLAPSLVCTTP